MFVTVSSSPLSHIVTILGFLISSLFFAVELFSFLLKHFFTYFHMLLNSLLVKVPSAVRTLHQIHGTVCICIFLVDIVAFCFDPSAFQNPFFIIFTLTCLSRVYFSLWNSRLCLKLFVFLLISFLVIFTSCVV